MLKKPCKIIAQESGEIRIYGNGHWIPMEYGVPDWHEPDPDCEFQDAGVESCFRYKGHKYFLEEFMRMDKNSPFGKEFHAYKSDSFFSGILIMLSEDGEAIKAYTYICS